MEFRNVGGYTIGIEYNAHSYSEAYTVWVYINGEKNLLSRYSETDYKKLTDEEIISGANFRKQQADASDFARKVLLGNLF